MKRASVAFLQIVTVLIGIGVFALMLWEPHLEGRNANATLFQVYFNDPFLAYAYAASIAFFVAVYQALKLLGYIGRNEAFSEWSVRSVRIIRYCAISLIGCIALPLAYLCIVRPDDDIAGGVAMGLFMIVASTVVVAVADVIERILRGGVEGESI